MKQYDYLEAILINYLIRLIFFILGCVITKCYCKHYNSDCIAIIFCTTVEPRYCLYFICDHCYHVVPDPVVKMDIEQDRYQLDDTAVLSCSAEIANTSLVSSVGKDVSLMMNINGVPLDVYQSSNDSSIITSGALLLQLPNIYFAKEYTCKAYLTSDSQFIEESNIISSKSSLRIQCKLSRPIIPLIFFFT